MMETVKARIKDNAGGSVSSRAGRGGEVAVSRGRERLTDGIPKLPCTTISLISDNRHI